MENTLTLHRARALHLGPFDWHEVRLEEVVRELQVELYIASMEAGDLAPINVVYIDENTYTHIFVTLCVEGPKPLTEVLERLAEEAALLVDYTPTGVLLRPIPVTEHEDEGEEDAVGQIAEVEPSAVIPGLPAFEEVPAPPPLLLWHELTAAQQQEQWQQIQSTIFELFPILGALESKQRRAFEKLFNAFARSPYAAVGVAELVMVYPPNRPSRTFEA